MNDSRLCAAMETRSMSSAGRKPDSLAGIKGPVPRKESVADHLASIDKLLSAAFELMKQTPAMDQAAIEHLRQLRVKIRYALSEIDSPDFDNHNLGGVPKTAPRLFKDRENMEEDPLSFTARIYSKWLWKSIARSDIRRLDPQLYNALYNLDNPSDKLDQIGLRTKKQLNDIRLESISKIKRPSTTLKMKELSPDQREDLRLHNLVRNRRRRSKPKFPS
jgi:hypothetical protein